MNPFLMTAAKKKRYIDNNSWGRPTLHEIFEKKAKEQADKEAFVDSGTRLTYRQAMHHIHRLACAFYKLGIEKDDVVVVMLPNIVEAALLRLALPRAGILAQLIMPAFGPSEVKHILNFTRARAIVIPWKFDRRDYYKMIQDFYPELEAQPKILVAGQETPPGTISVSTLMQTPFEDEIPATALAPRRIGTWEVQELNTTTGSTGMPKIAESYGWNQLIGHALREKWELTPEDNLGLIIPFPGGIANNFWASGIVGGCKMAFLEKFEVTDTLRFIERERITILFGVPTIAEKLLTAANLKEFDLTSLRIFFLSGAPTPPTLAAEAEQKLNCTVVTLLGCVDFGPISGISVRDRQEIRFTSAGKPFPGTEVRIVDGKGLDVPAGGTGELLCRGPYACTGYYNRPELTLEAYGGDKDGWYRTGDLVRMDPEGNLYVVGRLKEIIKRGGMTISPAEVEDFLRRHPQVADVAVVSMPDPVLGERVCAFAVLRKQGRLDLAAMTSFLDQEGLAKFKWPERLEIVEDFPMAGGQKISKKKLSEMIAEKLKSEGKL
ncbi:MAG: AMP-binding protein [Desulfobacterales bacterium]|nr:AMP-binding protein [Desulfobacterales bacterium]